ncbi:MAG TPA: lasso peptide biosynthesis B2 protein [Planctomycetota bacterium]|nr:lasso peptide biosynthesis B2 protein [Planctomycetota bacterium]
MRRLVLRAHVWWEACLILLLVKLLPLTWVLRLLSPPRWWHPYRGVSPDAIGELVRRRLARPRHMKRRACLRQGLMLFHFLCLAGHEPELHFAVFPAESPPRPMHAHCWVTLGGVACSPPAEPPCAEMMRYARGTGARLLPPS